MHNQTAWLMTNAWYNPHQLPLWVKLFASPIKTWYAIGLCIGKAFYWLNQFMGSIKTAKRWVIKASRRGESGTHIFSFDSNVTTLGSWCTNWARGKNCCVLVFELWLSVSLKLSKACWTLNAARNKSASFLRRPCPQGQGLLARNVLMLWQKWARKWVRKWARSRVLYFSARSNKLVYNYTLKLSW